MITKIQSCILDENLFLDGHAEKPLIFDKMVLAKIASTQSDSGLTKDLHMAASHCFSWWYF